MSDIQVPVDWLLLIFLLHVPWIGVICCLLLFSTKTILFNASLASTGPFCGDVRKHARRCLICSTVCILPVAAVTEEQDWHWCWWAMVYVNGWMGLIGISRSARVACHSQTTVWMEARVYRNINWTALTRSRTFRESGSQRNCLVNIQSNVNGWTSISSITDFA